MVAQASDPAPSTMVRIAARIRGARAARSTGSPQRAPTRVVTWIPQLAPTRVVTWIPQFAPTLVVTWIGRKDVCNIASKATTNAPALGARGQPGPGSWMLRAESAGSTHLLLEREDSRAGYPPPGALVDRPGAAGLGIAADIQSPDPAALWLLGRGAG